MSVSEDQTPDPAGRIVTHIVAVAARFPKTVLALIGVAMLASLFGATTLGVDTDSSKMLNPALDFQSRALALREAFPDDKTAIIVAVRSSDADAADRVVSDLSAALTGQQGIEEVFAPSIDPYLARNGLLYLSPEAFEDRLGRISQSANLLAGLRADQTVDGFLATLDQARRLAEGAGREGDLAQIYAEAAEVFASTAAGTPRDFGWTQAFTGETGLALRLITVRPALDYTLLNPAKPALRAIQQVVGTIALPDGVEVGITGDPVLRAEELQSVTAKIGLSLGLSLLLVAIVLWLALGSLGRVLLGLGALMATLVLTTGFAALAVGSLNLISIAFIVLMVGLGIDFAIHFLAHLDEKSGLGTGALPATARSIGAALLLTAASTALAFLAFTTTDFVGMAQLGLIGGAGVVIAFLVSITLVPAIVSLRPRLAAGKPKGRIPTLFDGRLAPWLAAGIGAAACIWAIEARFDADPMSLRNPVAPSVVSFGWLVDQPKNSPLRAAILARDEAEARALADGLQDLPGVENAVWLGSLIPDAQDEKLQILDLAWPSLEHAAIGAPEEIAEKTAITPERLADELAGQGVAQDAFAASLRSYAATRDDQSDAALATALFRNFGLMNDRLTALLEMDEITRETLPDGLSRRYFSAAGLYKVEVVPVGDIRDAETRDSFVATIREKVPEVTGAPVQIAGASATVAGAMISALAIAFAGAAILSLAYMRSVTGVVAILLPVLLAGTVCMAATVLLDMPFNYANVIVLPLMIGIGVDSGIHLALRARQEGQVFDTSTPMAALYSALTTIMAFGTLGLSDHRGTASMGILLAIGLTATVVMTFALTPPLARLSGRLSRRAVDTKG